MTGSSPLRVLISPDKFRGTLTGREASDAMERGVRQAAERGEFDALCTLIPLADGGEGTLDAFGGANRESVVTGPLGQPVSAPWRLDGNRAVIEMSLASGLALAGGATSNDPLAATTRGTGELILAAVDTGARDILIGVGGSATTDGGAGALQVLAPDGGPSLLSVDVCMTVCADVRTGFLDAATVFGPQKGATSAQVQELSDRLKALHEDYLRRFGIDLASVESAGAAGGLAGGLAAIGAQLVPGFDMIAELFGFDTALGAADLVITGEGFFDATSLDGKVVGGVIERARLAAVPTLVVCGGADSDVAIPDGVSVISLTDDFGVDAALQSAAACVTRAVDGYLANGIARV
ncbi:MAG: glycerate kinase [Nakamurella sp.]